MKDTDADIHESYHIGEGDVENDAMERIKGILDAKYEPADLRAVSKEAIHLEEEEQEKLYQLLDRYKLPWLVIPPGAYFRPGENPRGNSREWGNSLE
jgi:hypothetical protein